MNIDRAYRNQANGVSRECFHRKSLFTEDDVAGLPFHFDLRVGGLIWCEGLKSWSMNWGGRGGNSGRMRTLTPTQPLQSNLAARKNLHRTSWKPSLHRFHEQQNKLFSERRRFDRQKGSGKCLAKEM